MALNLPTAPDSAQPKLSTKEKILAASLQLFNERGERNVSTNHISAHLGMSPGNLYYHYPNKQAIIEALFQSYCQQVTEILSLPKGPMTLAHKAMYLRHVFRAKWQYRFFHRDSEHILADNHLRAQYQQYYRVCIRVIEQIYVQLNESGIMAIDDAEDRQALALGVWITITNWFSYVRTHLLVDDQELTEDSLSAGLEQLLRMEKPYIQAQYLPEFTALLEEVKNPEWIFAD